MKLLNIRYVIIAQWETWTNDPGINLNVLASTINKVSY